MTTNPREAPAPRPEPPADDLLTLTKEDVQPLIREDADAVRGGILLDPVEKTHTSGKVI